MKRRKFFHSSALGTISLLTSSLLTANTKQINNSYITRSIEDPTSNIPEKKYLFIDDYNVETINNLQRKLHRPKKQGLVMKPDRNWERGMTFAFSAPIWVPEEKIYKWVYRPYYKNWSALAISEDGVNWQKPNLGMVEFEGSKNNNIFSNDRILKVVHDPDAPDPSQRYKGLSENTPVVSEDLINWKDAWQSLGGDDSGSMTYDEQEKQFLVPVKIDDSTKESYRAFNLFTSKDFINWSDPHFFFGTDKKDQKIAIDRIRRWLSDPGRPRPLHVQPAPHMGWTPPKDIQDLPRRRHSWNAQCNNISVFPYFGQYIALITMLYPTGAYLPGYQNTCAFSMIEIASTRDLKKWTRFREPFIAPTRMDKGIIDNYERMLVFPVNRPIVRGNELWFYYAGSKEHQHFEDNAYSPGRYSYYMDGTPRDKSSLSKFEIEDIKSGLSALYLATLRLDGFVSLKAGLEEGSVITKPIDLKGKNLYVNLACIEEGYARIEILNNSSQAILTSKKLTGNKVALRVNWEGISKINSLIGQKIKLKIYLKRAEIYSFWMEEN